MNDGYCGRLDDRTLFQESYGKVLIYTQTGTTSYAVRVEDVSYLKDVHATPATEEELGLIRALYVHTMRQVFRHDVQRLGL